MDAPLSVFFCHHAAFKIYINLSAFAGIVNLFMLFLEFIRINPCLDYWFPFYDMSSLCKASFSAPKMPDFASVFNKPFLSI